MDTPVTEVLFKCKTPVKVSISNQHFDIPATNNDMGTNIDDIYNSLYLNYTFLCYFLIYLPTLYQLQKLYSIEL
jgi:hypothetical protein